MSTHSRGRDVPAEEYTFPDSSITVKVRRISPLLRDDIEAQCRREFPEPEVPMKKRNYGTEDEPDWIVEADPYDQAYRDAKQKWNVEHVNRVGDKLLWLAVRRGIEVEMSDDVLQQVKDLREDMSLVGVELDPDDKFIYVSRICVDKLDTLRELYEVLFSTSKPTKDEVDAMKATFPGNVQPERHLPVPSPEGKGRVERRILLDGSSEVLENPVA